MVLRLIEPTSGKLSFEGADLLTQRPGEMRKLRSRMQMVFQDPCSAIDPRYSVADAVMEPHKIQGVPSPFNLGPGCAFAARCIKASATCKDETPKLTAAGGGHAVACHHPD